jgi:hypothetical protein
VAQIMGKQLISMMIVIVIFSLTFAAICFSTGIDNLLGN